MVSEYERIITRSLRSVLPGIEIEEEIIPYLRSYISFLDGRIFVDCQAEAGCTYYFFVANMKGEWIISHWDGDAAWSTFDISNISRNSGLLSMNGKAGDFLMKFHVRENGEEMTYTMDDDEKPEYFFE